jgi:amidase
MNHLSKPSIQELRRLALENHFSLTPEEVRVFYSLTAKTLKSYERMITLANKARSNSNPRRGRGHLPSARENPLGAWAWKCSIKNERRTNGKLVGRTIAIKDNVAVAGIPLQNGSPLMKGFIPSVDATIVTRILDEGGEIIGKSRCENLCVSGGSHTSYPEPVRNPHNPSFMAGGSSSGSAALLGSDEVDMAIGADQAGSIRIPSSWCGVFGLKPTTGLVPYTGIIGMDPVLDTAGPMANTAFDVALLLEVIAGKDYFDPRQIGTPDRIPEYTKEIRKGVKGIRVGVVKEGFGWEEVSERDVDDLVRESAFLFQNLDAKVSEVSIPYHREALHVWTGIVTEGTWHHMIRDNGLEHLWSGPFDPFLLRHWARAVRRSGDKLAASAKLISLMGSYMSKKYYGEYYALARNLRYSLMRAYDRALESYDLLLMPTTPQKAMPFEENSSNLERSLSLCMVNLHNTCAFNVSGHPALSVPCGMSQGLPVGLMLIGRYYEESKILRAAYAFEKVCTTQLKEKMKQEKLS